MLTRKTIYFMTISCLTVLAVSSVFCAQTASLGKTKASQGSPIVWRDCKEIGIEGKGWTDTLSAYNRLPGKARGKASAAVWGLSHHSAGLCVRFTTDAASIRVRWSLLSNNLAMPHMPATGVSGVDLYVKEGGQWRFVGNGRPSGVSSEATFAVSPGAACLLYLPLYNGVKSVEIGIPEGRTISAYQAASVQPRKPIVFYGTSITQGGCASRPGMAFTAIVGRRLDVSVVNLGFSGSGKMEPAMADLLAELDPSVYVLDCLWNMNPQEVAERMEPFVKRLRLAHPNTPILLAEDSSFRNVSPTEKGRVLRTAFDKLKAEGVKNLYFLSSQNMLGTDGEGTVDGCHPNDLGMTRLADAFVQSLSPMVRDAKP